MKLIKHWYRFANPRFQTVHLDYHVVPQPRYTKGENCHGELLKTMQAADQEYSDRLSGYLGYKEQLGSIKEAGDASGDEPCWNNGFLPGLDIVGIYGMLSEFKSKKYVEVGSGNSTLVARKAVTDQNLPTKIVSIDPYPRTNIDEFSDEIHALPLEKFGDLDMFSQLEAGDVLFVDNSHRSFANSDVTVVFMELIPRLKPGVIVHVHDIYLPYDYPQNMCDRLYNEQYLLATMLWANPDRFKILLPNFYISEHRELSQVMNPLWSMPNLKGVEQHGGSFWFQVTS
jgi:hypothetical protein